MANATSDRAPTPTLKALTYFGDGDLPGLGENIRRRLVQAVAAVDPLRLPKLDRGATSARRRRQGRPMKPLPHTPALLSAAKRIGWFKPPEAALDSPVELLAYAMKHATDEDMALLLDHVGESGLREAIDKGPAGIIDARSWSYWNAEIGRFPAPTPPERDLG